MTSPRRGLKLVVCAVVAVVALGASVGVVEALVAWNTQAEAAEREKRYATAERTIATERAVLADFRRVDRGGGTTRAEYATAASAAALALSAAAEHAPAEARRRLRRLASAHDSARRSALRALSDPADDARLQPDFRRATRLLVQVADAVEALTASSAATAAASWPGTSRDYLELLAVAVAALTGIAWMAGRAIELVTRSGPPSRRSSDRELARLVSEARTDSLTGLANHRAFHDDLAAAIERRNTTGSLFSLMAIDLDGLKAVNDTGGHQAGDAHIVRLSQAISATLGTSGTVYRTGGDEFMVLLPRSRNWHSLNLAGRILGATKSSTGARTLSIGITETNGTEHRQALIRQADLALYEAKRSTMGVVPFQPGMKPAAAAPRRGEFSPDQKALVAALARAVDARDLGTRKHSELVAELATGIAARHGIEGHHLEQLRIAALLHDVGKIAVPEAILHKRTSLERSEEDQIRGHVTVGRDILSAAGFVDEATWVYYHHERWDGTGYPERLHGTEIPFEARIIAVADAFEVMTGTRPYRETVSVDQALAELGKGAGGQFDTSCVQALAELVSGNLSTDLLAPLRAHAVKSDDSSLQSRTGVP